jgi:hypothetical protein
MLNATCFMQNPLSPVVSITMQCRWLKRRMYSDRSDVNRTRGKRASNIYSVSALSQRNSMDPNSSNKLRHYRPAPRVPHSSALTVAPHVQWWTELT